LPQWEHGILREPINQKTEEKIQLEIERLAARGYLKGNLSQLWVLAPTEESGGLKFPGWSPGSGVQRKN
jgi:hypothetical protein